MPLNVGEWKFNSPCSTVMNSQITIERQNGFSDIKLYTILSSTILNLVA